MPRSHRYFNELLIEVNLVFGFGGLIKRPQPTIVRTLRHPFPDWRLRRSCENKCPPETFAKDTRKYVASSR